MPEVEAPAGGRPLRALQLISAQLEPLDDDLPRFFGRLSAAVAELVGARRAGFLRLEGTSLGLQRDAFGLDPEAPALVRGIPCAAGGVSPVERVVFGDEAFIADIRSDNPGTMPYRRWLDPLGAHDVVVVPWALGGRRLGMLAAFDSTASHGFDEEDAWVLRVAATTAALVWQQRRLAARLVETQSAETARMADLEEMKRNLLNLAAHELRGPVSVIRGYLSMLADGSITPEGLKRVIPILLGKAAQMDSLVTQMLEVARLEENRLELAVERVDLARLVRAAVDEVALLAPPGITVAFQPPPAPLLVDADPRRVSTILTNLLENAVKYSPEGGAVHCEVGCDATGCHVRVSDSGLGIAHADMERLFTRFGRIVTSENSHIPGTGLGLHLSRELARRQGGDISAVSELGRGSTFTLTLPPARAD